MVKIDFVRGLVYWGKNGFVLQTDGNMLFFVKNDKVLQLLPKFTKKGEMKNETKIKKANA